MLFFKFGISIVHPVFIQRLGHAYAKVRDL